MKRLLAALLLVASPALSQSNGWREIANGWGEIQTPPGYSTFPAPSTCTTAGQLPIFLGSTLALGCDAGLTYATATLAAPVHSGTSFVAAAPATITITGATNATPIVVTAVAHGLRTNDRVSISGITGNTNANGYFKITRLTADTFSLQNYSTGADIAGNGAYGGSPVATAGIVQAGQIFAGDLGYSFASDFSTRIGYSVAPGISVTISGTRYWQFALGLLTGYGSQINLSDSGGSAANAAILSRAAAATLQLGAAAANADGVDQRLQTQGGITGTDRAAGDLDLTTGLGTGAGYSKVTISAPTRVGTGTTAQSRAVRVTVSDIGVQWATGTRPTCDASARGSTWYVAGGAGVADTFEVCRKDAADAYAWVTLF